MKLVIAEKPSVARSIAGVLGATEKKEGYIQGNGYIVTWCIGHVETVVLLSHKNADTHINVNVEFGEGEGKIPVGKILEKAEDQRQTKELPIR